MVINFRSQRHLSVEVPIEPKKKTEAHHYCCKKDQIVDYVARSTEENAVSQFELKEKLSVVYKNSEASKFFDENKCPVCMSNYKEILMKTIIL